MNPPNKVVLLLWCTFFVAGLLEYGLSTGWQLVKDVTPVVHTIVISLLSFAWCKSHIQFNNITAPAGSALLAGLVAPIGVPVYFFRAFGLKQGAVRTLKAVLVFLVMILTYIFGMYLGEMIQA